MVNSEPTILFGLGIVAVLEAATWVLLTMGWLAWAEWTITYTAIILVVPLSLYAVGAIFFILIGRFIK